MDRVILHCDLNGFFASVECILNPYLTSVPMAVAGDPKNRHGIILAKNEIAKKYNIQTAETIWQAKHKCNDLVIVAPHYLEYLKYSRLINDIYYSYTDLIEPFGIDESWLDVTGVQKLFGTGQEIADKIRADVKKQLGLTVSVGVSFNKIFAKLGSDYKKPDATTVISRTNYKNIVYPLPADALLFVGKSVLKTLSMLDIKTIGDIANSDRLKLIYHLGKNGGAIWDYANGLDDSVVKSFSDERELKSVGNGMTFKHDIVALDDIKLGVNVLSEEIAFRLRKCGLKCSTICVSIKDPNFKSSSRQSKLSIPTHLAKEIAITAMALIQLEKNTKPIRAITITGTGLVKDIGAGEQLSLFNSDKSNIQQEKLEATLSKIRDKYGKNTIFTARTIQNDIGIEKNDE